MADEIRDQSIEGEEPPTGDAEKGAVVGGIGGVVAGAIAGAVAGPGGAVIGAVVGGVVGAAASGAAVAAVDRYDDDSNWTGFPDDMSLDSVADREPIIIHRDTTPPLDQMPGASETPIGVGMPEAVALSGATNTSELAMGGPIAPVVPPQMVAKPAEPETVTPDPDEPEPGRFGNPGTSELPADGEYSGDAEQPGNVQTPNRQTDGGWDSNSDANQIDINPARENVRESYGYADNPDDDRREGQE